MINQRSEIVFLYDVKRCNPNGDPMDANRPRIDEESGKCLVTDVRLKRTVRDYLYEKGYNGLNDNNKDIFIRDDHNGRPVTGAERSSAYKDIAEFASKFIDVRMFGGVSAAKGKAFNLTGPVQFGMGISLHEVKENFIKGTGAFATSEGAQQKTFREEYNITYGLIGFHGVINENAAKHTKLSEDDVQELMGGLWDGTKNLLTRSKKGHMPRLLVKIDYKETNFFIGDLVERISIVMKNDKKVVQLEDVSNYVLNTASLNKALSQYKDKIAKIHITHDDRLELSEPLIQI